VGRHVAERNGAPVLIAVLDVVQGCRPGWWTSCSTACAAKWFRHARSDQVLDVPVLIAPPEESIWSKAFIMERERYDGAEVAHLLRACAGRMDWQRLLQRFGRTGACC
jgi:hypothetical protein